MSLVQTNWNVISANIWLFLSWTVAVGAAVWAAIHFLYRHRIEQDGAEIQRLQSRLSDLKADQAAGPALAGGPVQADVYVYPDAGDNGLNILGHSVTDIVVGQTYSMAATIPAGGRLKLQMSGTPPRFLEEMPGGWHFNVSMRNWQANLYDQTDHTQWFTARSGEAELAFIPARPGKIVVTVFEGSHEASWEKTLKVVA
ncbi:hypothetical protein [Dyella sp. 333MFSha]|uniref:hypothetical protein n=1 Tax=Dyella sp. 333MFSha TaxID=1798240 RepID=UPI00088B52BA|nr:hypothetical protein [Dyella sp. 333MFSha]SDF26947.1 hypothetical protein SAMN04515659_0550 [Dyella sp. 333MFSha]